MKKEIRLEFDAISENEGLARVVVAAFLTQLDPTLEEVQDVKTAVSEAVTNAIVHGYEEHGGRIILEASLENGILEVVITDKGVGIEPCSPCLQPEQTVNEVAWDLLLWKHSWIGYRLQALPEKERAYICGRLLKGRF